MKAVEQLRSNLLGLREEAEKTVNGACKLRLICFDRGDYLGFDESYKLTHHAEQTKASALRMSRLVDRWLKHETRKVGCSS